MLVRGVSLKLYFCLFYWWGSVSSLSCKSTFHAKVVPFKQFIQNGLKIERVSVFIS